jgi:hypothetical protein
MSVMQSTSTMDGMGHGEGARPPTPTPRPHAGPGAPPGPPSATFLALPKKRVLTLNLDVPEPWLVEPVQVT